MLDAILASNIAGLRDSACTNLNNKSRTANERDFIALAAAGRHAKPSDLNQLVLRSSLSGQKRLLLDLDPTVDF